LVITNTNTGEVFIVYENMDDLIQAVVDGTEEFYADYVPESELENLKNYNNVLEE